MSDVNNETIILTLCAHSFIIQILVFNLSKTGVISNLRDQVNWKICTHFDIVEALWEENNKIYSSVYVFQYFCREIVYSYAIISVSLYNLLSYNNAIWALFNLWAWC